MFENNLLAFELVRNFNKPGADRMCIKIDLQKAYDRISREFIIYVMKQMGFPHQFTTFIYSCISTPTFSILINGMPIGFFQVIEVLGRETLFLLIYSR